MPVCYPYNAIAESRQTSEAETRGSFLYARNVLQNATNLPGKGVRRAKKTEDALPTPRVQRIVR